MHRTLTLAVALALAVPALAAGPTGFVSAGFKDSEGVEVRYAVFVPHTAKPETKLPVILFLHGSGECGADGNRQTEVGLGPAVRQREQTFPFLVVFPQAQKAHKNLVETWYPGRPDGERAIAMLDAATKAFNGDPKRSYITGNSMGGFGTWSLAHKHRDRFAAMAPVCGGGNPVWAAQLKDIPCWCFHSADDKVVPVDFSRAMVKALELKGAKPKYDEYAGVGHDSWTPAYGTDALYEWMLSHKLK